MKEMKKQNMIEDGIRTVNNNLFKSYKNVTIKKGEELGGFKLGSTVVFIFQTKKNTRMNHKKGDLIRLGDPLSSNIDRWF